MDAININNDLINGFKTSFDNEKNRFNYTSYNTLRNSYLATCSDSTVQTMYSKLNSLYSNVDSSYSSIGSYWSSFLTDFNTLENSLISEADSLSKEVSDATPFNKSTEGDYNTSNNDNKEKLSVPGYIKYGAPDYTDLDAYYYQHQNDTNYITEEEYREEVYYSHGEYAYKSSKGTYDAETHKRAYYKKVVKEVYGDDLSYEEREDKIKHLEALDRGHGYQALHANPVKIEGSSYYTSPDHTDLEYDESSYYFKMGYNKYSGSYLRYYNEYGVTVTAPLATFQKSNGAVVATEIPEEYQEKYINNVTKYYVDVMYETFEYSDEYGKTVFYDFDKLTLAYAPDDENGAAAYAWEHIDYEACDRKVDVVLKTDQFMDNSFNVDDSGYKYMISASNHELGHVYNFNRNLLNTGTDDNFDETLENIRLQVYEQYGQDETFLRDYAYTNNDEFFAEVMAEYYSYTSKGSPVYNSEDLMAVKIDIYVNGVHYNNLYDYITHEVINKKIGN